MTSTPTSVEPKGAEPLSKYAEQSAFEDWLERTSPSGDVEQVQRQWEASSDLRDALAAFNAPATGKRFEIGPLESDGQPIAGCVGDFK